MKNYPNNSLLNFNTLYAGGDTYEVTDNGVAIGKTSKVDHTSEFSRSVYASSSEDAFHQNNTGFSKASFPLSLGNHTIAINVLDSANESGTGAVRISRKVQSFYKKNKHNDWHDDEDEDDHNDEGGKFQGDHDKEHDFSDLHRFDSNQEYDGFLDDDYEGDNLDKLFEEYNLGRGFPLHDDNT
jgi:hypothetical protein